MLRNSKSRSINVEEKRLRGRKRIVRRVTKQGGMILKGSNESQGNISGRRECRLPD